MNDHAFDDYLDLIEYAGDHLVRARCPNASDNIEPIESAISRLTQALAVAKSGDFARDDEDWENEAVAQAESST